MEWKQIDGYENYSVSINGEVRNDKFDRIMKQTLDNKGYYVMNLCKNGKPKLHLVHRLIALAFIPLEPGKDFVDHHDGERANNSVENLRWATQQENNQNQSIRKNNKSGFKGVHFENGKWKAQIGIDGKRIHLGYFETIEEAVTVRSARANIEFGEFTNSCERS